MKMSIIKYIPQYSSKTPDDDKLCRDSSPHADGMGVHNQIFIFATPAHAATSSHRWELKADLRISAIASPVKFRKAATMF